MFPYHYGSYATGTGKTHLAIGIVVSIPLWFLRNHEEKHSGGSPQTQFPYHYGSYATREVVRIG